MPTARRPLNESDVERDPITQFARWYESALATVRPLPEAMALATSSRAGHPTVRMVLLKSFDAHGFVFYTNYRSRKGLDLARNARASLLFYWGTLDRQVRIEGRVAKIAPRESDDYFATRPRGSQLAAWASAQSAVVAGRAALERSFAAIGRKRPGAVPRPPHWGGYRLAPETVEFWQSRDDRLHDRLVYRLERGRWRLERLAP